MKYVKQLCCLMAGLLFSFASLEALVRPEALYLTWRNNPQTTMTVLWVTDGTQRALEKLSGETTAAKEKDKEKDKDKGKGKEDDDKDDNGGASGSSSVSLQYRAANDNGGSWLTASGTSKAVPFAPNYKVNRVEITGLRANGDYVFRLDSTSPQYKFRTMPASLGQGVRFICAGDVYSSSLLEVGDKTELATRMHKTAAKQDPLFVFLGGDLAYAGDDMTVWLEWLKLWTSTMVTSDGRLIPMLTTPGNHDFSEGINERNFPNSSYATLFPTAGNKSYYVVDFMPQMSFFALDSSVVVSSGGAQSEWLKTELKRRSGTKYKFAIYHVPAYPSYRDEENRLSVDVQRYFVPHFDKYGVAVAFENHDHNYKRTKLIYKDRENSRGVLYIGDGAMGVNPDRDPADDGIPWYLAKWAQKRHCLVVDLTDAKGTVRAVDEFGAIIDQVDFKAR